MSDWGMRHDAPLYALFILLGATCAAIVALACLAVVFM